MLAAILVVVAVDGHVGAAEIGHDIVGELTGSPDIGGGTEAKLSCRVGVGLSLEYVYPFALGYGRDYLRQSVGHVGRIFRYAPPPLTIGFVGLKCSVLLTAHPNYGVEGLAC